MLSKQTQQQIENLAKNLGLYIYDIEFLKENDNMILRISITRKSPNEMADSKKSVVSLEDCQRLSELVSPLLDVEMTNLENYHLEVSSPGIERVLKKTQHYHFSLGETLRIKLSDKCVVEGILEKVDSESISLKTADGAKNIAMNDIKKAKVIFEF